MPVYPVDSYGVSPHAVSPYDGVVSPYDHVVSPRAVPPRAVPPRDDAVSPHTVSPRGVSPHDRAVSPHTVSPQDRRAVAREVFCFLDALRSHARTGPEANLRFEDCFSAVIDADPGMAWILRHAHHHHAPAPASPYADGFGWDTRKWSVVDPAGFKMWCQAVLAKWARQEGQEGQEGQGGASVEGPAKGSAAEEGPLEGVVVGISRLNMHESGGGRREGEAMEED